MELSKFYEHFNVEPRKILSDCSFENLMRMGIEEGTDVCIHVEDVNFKCKDCELSKPKYPFFPSIDMETWFRLSLIEKPSMEYMDFIDEQSLMSFYITCKEQEKIKQVLQQHVDELSKF